VAPASVDHTQVQRVNGSWSLLDRADLVDPAARFAGALAPIFAINGAETQYLRPLRGPDDTNGDDQIVASDGAALDLYVYSGPILAVTATATPTHVAAEQPVTLRARVTNATAADGALTYTWSFQDGATAHGATVRHAYTVPGVWHPVVTVQGRGNDSGGASAPLSVTVGTPPKGGPGGTRGGTSHSPHTGGPARSRGSTPDAAPTATATTPSAPAASTPAPSAPAPNGTPAPSATPAANATPARRRRARTHRRTRRVRRPAARLVTGRLISDVIPVSAAQLARQQRPAALAARSGGATAPPYAGVAATLTVAALLAFGAGLELRARRRFATM
jgi:pyruvate/2-oxoglutarate dehydrogenase complex dihydrolipoamide acyltransferase (E2) component